MEFVARMTNPIALDFLHRPTTGTANTRRLAPSPKAPNVRLVTAAKLVAPPNDIVPRILCVLLSDLHQLTDFTTPLRHVRDKAYIMNATIALII